GFEVGVPRLEPGHEGVVRVVPRADWSMWQLVVKGPRDSQRIQHLLEPGRAVRIGRGADAELVVPWERWLSRLHCVVRPGEKAVELEKLPGAMNEIYVKGDAADRATLAVGEHFVVGETTFHLGRAEMESPTSGEKPVEEVTFSRQDLRRIQYRDADR